MSVRAINHVWHHSRQKGGALLVLLAIADFADDDGRAWPAVDTLARKARMSARNVNHVLRKLKAAGELTIEPSGGPHRVNLFRLNITENFTLKTFQDEAHFRGGVKPTSPLTLKPTSPKPSLEPSLEPSLSRPKGEPVYPRSFLKFWSLYPRRVGKAKAVGVWRRLKVDDALLARILAAVEAWRQSTEWQKDGGAYIPHPTTWLNRAGWEDEVTIPGNNNSTKNAVLEVYKNAGASSN